MKTGEKVKNQREKIYAYILDRIDGSGYDKELTTDADKIRFLLDTFKSEYGQPENIRYYGSEQKTFENWCRGLPSCFNIEFYDDAIIELGKEWGLIPADASETKQRNFIDQYWSRIYMNVQQLKRKINATLTPKFKI